MSTLARMAEGFAATWPIWAFVAFCTMFAVYVVWSEARLRKAWREAGDDLAAEERKRLALEAEYRRYRAEAPRRRGQPMPPRPFRVVGGGEG